jgi:ATP-binding cassette subfamily B protein
MKALYIEALDELLARDLAFFHDNFAGSLTKRALSYARRFENAFDVLCFQVCSTLLPLLFVAVVLWRYSPWLIMILVGMLAATFFLVFPLIRHGRLLVGIRESASNVVAGHIADSIANAEAVRAFARENDEARIHAGNVADYGAKTLTSWDYQNMRVDMVTAPMLVLTNTFGLIAALWLGGRGGTNLEAVFITFTYYATATRVMWEFNRIYSQHGECANRSRSIH